MRGRFPGGFNRKGRRGVSISSQSMRSHLHSGAEWQDPLVHPLHVCACQPFQQSNQIITVMLQISIRYNCRTRFNPNPLLLCKLSSSPSCMLGLECFIALQALPRVITIPFEVVILPDGGKGKLFCTFICSNCAFCSVINGWK